MSFVVLRDYHCNENDRLFFEKHTPMVSVRQKKHKSRESFNDRTTQSQNVKNKINQHKSQNPKNQEQAKNPKVSGLAGGQEPKEHEV